VRCAGGIPSEWTYPYVSGGGNASLCHGAPLPPGGPHTGAVGAAANVTGHVSISSNDYSKVMCAPQPASGTGIGSPPANITSAPGLGPPQPHLHRGSAHLCHICTGTGLIPATSAPGLGSRSADLLGFDWASSRAVAGTRWQTSARSQSRSPPTGAWRAPHVRWLAAAHRFAMVSNTCALDAAHAG
jgi:hypothetical protein